MENQNNTNEINEQMPQAQSMKAMDKKHMTLVYIGLGCWLLSLVFENMHLDGLWLFFCLAGLVLNCIGIYKTIKYKKANNSAKKK